MSNRHWEFVNDEILSDLNDDLAMRHGAQYSYKVPEASFDWDVEFAAVKDRSGNKLREQYLSAWVVPSLVGPDENTVHQLRVRLNWDSSSKEVSKGEVAELNAATDKVLGSPIKKNEDTPGAQTEVEKALGDNEVITSSVRSDRLFRVASRLCLAETENKAAINYAEKIVKLLQGALDIKLIDSEKLQNVELGHISKEVGAMQRKSETFLLSNLLKVLTEASVDDSLSENDISRVLHQMIALLEQAVPHLGLDPARKREVLRQLDLFLLQLHQSHSGKALITVIGDTWSAEEHDRLIEIFDFNIEVLKEVLKSVPKMNFYNIVGPQKAEDYVEEIKAEYS